MKIDDLKIITLLTPIYHSFLGEGLPEHITPTWVTVKFKQVKMKFGTSGIVGTDRFIDEIFLEPVSILIKPSRTSHIS